MFKKEERYKKNRNMLKRVIHDNEGVNEINKTLFFGIHQQVQRL